jgi:hypothetical protein
MGAILSSKLEGQSVWQATPRSSSLRRKSAIWLLLLVIFGAYSAFWGYVMIQGLHDPSSLVSLLNVLF